MAQTRLAVLDGLRGIAVLLVLWYHIWEISWLPAPLPGLQFIPETGFIGVDLFFFISGFVIVYPFVKALINKDVQPAWISFAYRRALKIVPSYALSIALVMALGYVQFASPQDAFKQIVTHLLFIHTWFADTAGGINGVLWTLAVEVEFYAIFPLIWLAFRRWPYVTAAVMILIANAFRQYAFSCCLHTSALIMIENLPSFLDTFAFGMICAYIYVRYRENWRGNIAKGSATLAAAAGFAMLAFMLHGLWTIRAQPDWSTAWAIANRTPSAFVFALMALGSLLAYRWWQRLLANPVLLFFAVISYNLYLYHQALARLLFKWRIPPFAGNNEHFDPVWQLRYSIIAFVVTVVFAAAVTYAFERPILSIPLERFKAAALSPLRRIGALPRA